MYLNKGDIYPTNSFGDVVIIEYTHSSKVRVKFLDTGTIIVRSSSAIRRGQIRDPCAPTVCGIGYMGIGPYSRSKHPKLVGIWRSMINRCHNPKQYEYHPTYRYCSVCEYWLNFQNYAEWYHNCLSELKEDVEYHVDKDILYQGNTIYSPDKCCLVTRQINNLVNYNKTSKGSYLTGVSLKKSSGTFLSELYVDGKKVILGMYSTEEEASQVYIREKELLIRRKALESFNNKEITKHTYEALINIRVGFNS